MTRGRRTLIATVTLEQNDAGSYVARACITDQPMIELDPSPSIAVSFDALARRITQDVKGARLRTGK